MKRRFIAGAVCPQCRAMDRLVIERDGEGRVRRCVACGFSEAAPEAGAVAPSTRFSRPRSADAGASPVRIIGPDEGKT